MLTKYKMYSFFKIIIMKKCSVIKWLPVCWANGKLCRCGRERGEREGKGKEKMKRREGKG